MEAVLSQGSNYVGVAVRTLVSLRCFETLSGIDSNCVYSPRLVERIMIRTLQKEQRGRDSKDGERSWILVNSITE